MIYSQEEKAKMDAVLEAFQSYIDGQEDYDVLYSKKAGYLRVMVGESCDTIFFPIEGFADMVRMFVNDFLSDEERRTGNSQNLDHDRVRSLLAPRLDALGEHRQEAYGILEETLDACRRRCAQFRRDRLEQIQELEELLQVLRASLQDAEQQIGI